MSLQGKAQLLRRLDAVKGWAQPVARAWAASTTRSAKRRVPVKTGRLQRSIRTRVTSKRGAIVVGRFTANFVDHGTRAHDEKPKRGHKALRYGGRDGRPMFAKRVHHRGAKAHPFKRAAALDGLRENPGTAVLLKLWNDAA